MLRLDRIKSIGFSPKRVGRFLAVGGSASVIYFTTASLIVSKAGTSEILAANPAIHYRGALEF